MREVVHAEAAGSELTVESVVTVLVVDPALLLVRQDLVSLGDLLELLFRDLFWVLGDVRMVLAGELTVCTLDRIRIGVLGDAQHFVVISRHDHSSSTIL